MKNLPPPAKTLRLLKNVNKRMKRNKDPAGKVVMQRCHDLIQWQNGFEGLTGHSSFKKNLDIKLAFDEHFTALGQSFL